MYCRNCGQQAQDQDRFCGACGHELKPVKITETVAPLLEDKDVVVVKNSEDVTFPKLEQLEKKARQFAKTRYGVQVVAWFLLVLGTWLGIAGFLGTMSTEYREAVFFDRSSDVKTQVIGLGIFSTILIGLSVWLFWKKVYGGPIENMRTERIQTKQTSALTGLDFRIEML